MESQLVTDGHTYSADYWHEMPAPHVGWDVLVQQPHIYVESLIGTDTVNTMPPQTLQAFKHHGWAEETIIDGTDAAHVHMAKLAALGIDIPAVTDKLEADGVAAFE